MKRLRLILAVLALASAVLAQDIQVNRQNKTIAITADESVTADAEVAVLDIGFHNYAASKEDAYGANLGASERIIQALLAAKVPKSSIETEKLSLTHAQTEESWTPDMKKQRQFIAQQSWHVTASASTAQAIVDVAVQAGANEVSDVDWNVKDPVELQAKAGAAALAKARSIADQMAKGLGIKLGELVYASNRVPVPKMFRAMSVNTENATLSGTADKQPKLTLFPQKVTSQATVYAVFAIE